MINFNNRTITNVCRLWMGENFKGVNTMLQLIKTITDVYLIMINFNCTSVNEVNHAKGIICMSEYYRKFIAVHSFFAFD